MNRVKDNSSVDPNYRYSNSYSHDTELEGYNNNNNNNVNVNFMSEFKIDTSVSGSHSAPTSLMTGVDHFNYPQYTPNMDNMQCVQSTDDSYGSSCSSGTKLSYPHSHELAQTPSYIQSSELSIDSYFSNGEMQVKSTEVDENENSMKDESRRGRGRGRGGSHSVRKRQLNQENNDEDRNSNGNISFHLNSCNGKGKHGKALARHPFIPSYMDPNNGPHLCVVCRHNASGFHYRVMACEGCKGFFRRTVQNNLVYSCKFNNKCEIQPHNRAQCQECRWRKCLDVGMAKDLVLSEEARRAKKELIAANRAKKLTSDRHTNRGAYEFKESTSLTSAVDKTTYKLSDEDEQIISQIKSAFDETAISKTELTTDFQDPNVIRILQCIVDHHVTSLIIKCDILDDGNIHSARFNYSQQFNALSIIVKPMLQRIVSFAFMLPRFSDLMLNDQIILLKNACFDIVTLRNAISFCEHSQTLRLESDFVIKKENLKTNKLLEPTFVFASRICALNLDYIEISLMAALALLSCDRIGLQETAKIDSIQDDILRSIDGYMKYNLVNIKDSNRQSELYASILPELRSTTCWHTQIMINSTETFINNFLPLLKAIYHYPEVQVCPPFVESSNSRFMLTALSNSSNSKPINVNVNQCIPVYNSDMKYLNFPYITQTMASSLYPALDTSQSVLMTNLHSNSHLATNSGQLINPHLQQQLLEQQRQLQFHHQQQQQQQFQSSTSSFTEMLIDSSSDIKPNQTTDNCITQELTMTSSPSSSIHANHVPVTNHKQSTNNDPVFDFSNDLI